MKLPPKHVNLDLFAGPNDPQPGDHVSHYTNGWRVGTVVEIVGSMARVGDILGLKRPKLIPLAKLTKVPQSEKTQAVG
jgi:hypothetical protein